MDATRKLIAVILLGIGLALGVVVAKPKAPLRISDVDFRGAHLTEAQKRKLVDSYNSGHPQPIGQYMCCCGGKSWDSSREFCREDKVLQLPQ